MLAVSIVENPYLNVIVCSNITYLIFLAIFALFIKAIPFQKIERVANVQFVVLLMMSFSAMYLRSSLEALYNKGGSDASFILSYVLILLAFCMLSLCLFERYLASQQERLHATARSISNEYRLRSIEQQNNSNKAATGSSLLNGLLSQKIDKARHDHIRFSADLNAAPLCFISVFDLCAIFGNAIDNSIEACRKIADPTRRFIDITSRFVAGCLIVSIVNSYDGGLTIASGVPRTTKKTIPFHGIGMTSINDSPQKYEAEMSISLNRPGIFNLTLVIPLREAAPEEASVQH